MIRLPNTVPIPAPDPATPTVAAPAPMNFAAVSMSLETALVWKERDRTTDWLRGSKAWRGVGGGGRRETVSYMCSNICSSVSNSTL